MAEKKLADLPPSYTNLGFDNEPIPGPSAPIDQDEHIMHSPTTDIADAAVPPYEDNASRIPDYKPPSLVFEDIYDACVQHVKKHCCYGSRFINRMKLTEIDNKRALHYTLESYGEKRETVIEYTPYRGGPIDGHGPVPDPWEMAIQRPTHFSNCSAKFQVPHTTHVNTCWRCDGLGKVTCSSCSGGGEEDCWHCHGRGRDDDGRCFSCSGTGKRECSSCSGTGKVTCKKCDGFGKIKDTKYLVVTWKNHPNDFVTYTNKLPQEYIRKAGGVVLFTETCSRLEPVTDAPDATVNAASAMSCANTRHRFSRRAHHSTEARSESCSFHQSDVPVERQRRRILRVRDGEKSVLRGLSPEMLLLHMLLAQRRHNETAIS